MAANYDISAAETSLNVNIIYISQPNKYKQLINIIISYSSPLNLYPHAKRLLTNLCQTTLTIKFWLKSLRKGYKTKGLSD